MSSKQYGISPLRVIMSQPSPTVYGNIVVVVRVGGWIGLWNLAFKVRIVDSIWRGGKGETGGKSGKDGRSPRVWVFREEPCEMNLVMK